MIDGVILKVELAQAKLTRKAVGADERRVAGLQAGERIPLNRQEFTISPEVWGDVTRSTLGLVSSGWHHGHMSPRAVPGSGRTRRELPSETGSCTAYTVDP